MFVVFNACLCVLGACLVRVWCVFGACLRCDCTCFCVFSACLPSLVIASVSEFECFSLCIPLSVNYIHYTVYCIVYSAEYTIHGCV